MWQMCCFFFPMPDPLRKATEKGKMCFRVLTHVDRWISRTLNQISMTKLNSRCTHEHFWKCSIQTMRITKHTIHLKWNKWHYPDRFLSCCCYGQRTFQLRCVHLQREKIIIAPIVWERTPAYILSVFLSKTYELFQTRGKWTCDDNKFPWLFQNFYDLSFFHDFSRPGNDHFKMPWLFHDRTNPVLKSSYMQTDLQRRDTT